MTQSVPSRRQANNGTLLGALNLAFRKVIQNLDNTLPAKVVSYDRATNRAVVRPVIQVLTTENQAIDRPQMVNIPVFTAGGGGFVLNFPLRQGDLGWIHATDRDISLFLQRYTEATPNTERLHSFEDAVFYPDVMRGYTINEEDQERVVLQSLDGGHRIAVGDDIIKVTGSNVEVEASSSAKVTAPSITLTGNVTIQGDITHEGNQNTTGTITASTDVSGGGISLKNHLTTGVTPGMGTSGPPE